MIEHSVSNRQRIANQQNESLVRWLLSHWVSELEPAIAFDRDGHIIGLTIADAPVGSAPSVFWPA